MNIRILIVSAIFLFGISCVPQRKFQDLQKAHTEALQKNADCNTALNESKDQNENYASQIKTLQTAIQDLARDTALVGSSNRKINTLYAQTNDAYERLLDKQKELESHNTLRTQELSAEMKELERKLNEKEVELDQRQISMQKQTGDLNRMTGEMNTLKADLEKLQKDLTEREKRVQELSQVLNQKDSAAKALKNTISNALLSFKDKGMSVNIKNGKVYVSVDEKLLFESGKYTVNAAGKSALLQLAKALNEQASDVNIVVEGHTDNKPLVGSGTIKDNWDLSVLRATEVTRLLAKDGKVIGVLKKSR
ncbi:MAG: cell envelope biogenesis protein OmpA [Sphingobacteriales bacterium]|nr:MAG: cell envelope biogenesis protein OmpA [Sphingobacteriales bacterium]